MSTKRKRYDERDDLSKWLQGKTGGTTTQTTQPTSQQKTQTTTPEKTTSSATSELESWLQGKGAGTSTASTADSTSTYYRYMEEERKRKREREEREKSRSATYSGSNPFGKVLQQGISAMHRTLDKTGFYDAADAKASAKDLDYYTRMYQDAQRTGSQKLAEMAKKGYDEAYKAGTQSEQSYQQKVTAFHNKQKAEYEAWQQQNNPGEYYGTRMDQGDIQRKLSDINRTIQFQQRSRDSAEDAVYGAMYDNTYTGSGYDAEMETYTRENNRLNEMMEQKARYEAALRFSKDTQAEETGRKYSIETMGRDAFYEKARAGKAKYEDDQKAAAQTVGANILQAQGGLDYLGRPTRIVTAQEADRMRSAAGAFGLPQDDNTDWGYYDITKFYAMYDDNPEQAKAWLQQIKTIRDEQEIQAYADQYGQEWTGRVGAFFMSPAISLASGLDPYGSWGQKASRIAEGMQKGVTEGLTEHGLFDTGALAGEVEIPLLGKVSLGTFAGIGMSMVQSGMVALPAMAIGDEYTAIQKTVEFLGTALMGSSAAASDYREKVKAGWSETDAMTHSIWAGLAEAGFEYISLDKLVDQDVTAGIVRNFFTQGGIEASEEFCTTVANRITDAVIARQNGYDTSIEDRAKELVAQGYSYEGAMQEARHEWYTELINDAFAGFVSGGGMTMMHHAAASVEQAAVTRGQRADFARSVQGEEGAVEAARKYAADRGLKEVKDSKGSTRQDARQGKAMEAVQADIVERIEKAAKEGGVQGANQAYSEMVEKYGDGIRTFADAALDSAVSSAVTATTEGRRANAYSVLAHQEAVEGIQDERAREVARGAVERAAYMAAMQANDEAQWRRASDYSRNHGQDMTMQATVTNEDGSERQVGIESVNTAEGTVKLAGGETVSFDNLTADTDTKDVIQAMLTSDMTEEASARMLRTFQAQTAEGMVSDPYRWAMDYVTSYDRGRVGSFSLEKAQQSVDVLHADTVKIAYEAGQAVSSQITQAQRDKLNAALAIREKGASGRTGSLDVGELAAKIEADEGLKAEVERIRKFAEVFGIDVGLFESGVKNGRYQGENGRYQDGKIWLDINAGRNKVGDVARGMVQTMAHEMTHFMQEYNPEDYAGVKRFVMQQIAAQKGENAIKQLVAEKKKRHTGSKPLSTTMAEDEIVADFCEDMLTDKTALETMARENPKGFQALVQWIKDFMQKVFDKLAGRPAGSYEVQVYRSMEQSLRDAFGEAWGKGIVGAVQTHDVVGSLREAERLGASAQMAEEATMQQSDRLDEETLEFLDNQEHVTVYRAMQLIDGQLYPPMAAKVEGKLVDPTEIGKWYQSVERPDLVKNGKFTLNKGNGTSVPAAYNPYFHCSASPLNDQFSSAYKRPNLVVVEGIIPKSELTSGYRAEGAKNSVGETQWHAGPVASKLKGAKARRVFLSRYFQVTRIMSDAEVAGIVAKTLQGENVSIPSNVVTPSLLEALKANGVAVDETGIERFEGQHKKKNAPEGVKYSVRPDIDTDLQSIETRNYNQNPTENPDIRKQDRDAEYLELAKAPEKNAARLQEMVDEAAKAAGYTIKAYHGTPKKFNVFSKDRIGSTTDYGWFGKGFYFTEKKDVASVYAGYLNDSNVIEAYLNVHNPFDFNEYPGAEDKTAGQIMEEVTGKKYGRRGELTEDDKAQRSEDFTEWLRKNKYDGVRAWSQIMILDSEQAKRSDPVTYDDSGNVIPLSERFNRENQDIRYSSRPTTDSTGRELSEGQQEYFRDSAIRDENGQLLTMWHGTTAFGEITQFKKGKTGWLGPGIYLTNRKADAQRYADAMGPGNGSMYELYANVTNPLIVTSGNPVPDILRAAYGKDSIYKARSAKQTNDPHILTTADIKRLQAQGYDGIMWKFGKSVEVSVFNSNQVKRTDNQTPTSNPDIRYQVRNYQEAINNNDMDLARKLVEEAAAAHGYTIHAYHGTSRADRVGNVFRPERATSGPMAFFSSDKAIADNYAKGKSDTSIAYDSDYDTYETQFRALTRKGAKYPLDMKIEKAWGYIDLYKRNQIREKAGQLRFDWDGDDDTAFILDPNNKEAGGGFQWQLKEARGNVIKALIEQWLNSGNLFNEESRFLEVLDLVGITEELQKVGLNVTYKDPNYREEKTYDVFLRLSRPFNTAKVNNRFIENMQKWFDKQPYGKYDRESVDADMWDKNSVTMEEFIERLRNDLENGTTHAWTSVPDFVTDYLKHLKYDGIVDKGGKYSGLEHTVYIPFYSEQVKSAETTVYDDKGELIPLSQRFNTENEDIRYSMRDNDAPSDMDLLDGFSQEDAANEEQRRLLREAQASGKKLREAQRQLERLRADLQALAGDNPSRITIKDFRRNVLDLFGIPSSERSGDIGNMVQSIAEGVLAGNKMSLEDISFFFQTFVESGTMRTVPNEYVSAIRDELKGRKIYVNDQVKEDLGEDYAALRKRAFGLGVTLTNNSKDMGIDQHWAELSEMYPGAFDSEELDLGTMLDQMISYAESGKASNVSILDGMRQVEEQTGEPVRDQLQRMYDSFVRHIEIMEDRGKLEAKARAGNAAEVANAKKQAAKAREELSKIRKERNEWKKKATSAEKKSADKLQAELRKIVRRDAAQLAEAVRQKEALAKKLQQQVEREQKILTGKLNTPQLAKMLKTARETAAQEMAKHKDEVFARAKDRKRASELRQRIKNLSDEMKRRMTRPTDGAYVPASLYGSMTHLADVLDEFLAPNPGTKAAERYKAMLDGIRRMSSEYAAVADMDDPVYSTEYDEQIKDAIDAIERTLTRNEQTWLDQLTGDTQKGIRELSTAELQHIYELMKSINYNMKNAAKSLSWNEGKSLYEAMRDVAAQQQELTPLEETGKFETSKRGRLLRKMSTMRAVEMMSGYQRDAALYQLMHGIEQGVVDADSWVMNYDKAMQPLKNGKNELEYRRAISKKLDFGATTDRGTKVLMTKMQAIQILMTAEREAHNDKLVHLQKGGAVIRDKSSGKSYTIQVTPKLLKNIQDSLTEWDNNYIWSIYHYFEREGKRTNEILYKLKHRVLQTEKYYVPYQVDKNYLETKLDSSDAAMSMWVKTPGSTNALAQKASQPVYIDGMDAVMGHHVREIANYIGLALAIRDFSKVYNGMLSQGDGENPLPVKETIFRNFGVDGQKLLTQAVIDIQGGRRGNQHRTGIGKFLEAMQSSFYKTALLINPSVTIKQAASYIAIESILDHRAVIAGNRPIFVKADKSRSTSLIFHLWANPSGATAQRIFNEIDAHTSMHYMRRQGMSMRELASQANRSGPIARAKGMIGASMEQAGWIGHKARQAVEAISPLNWIQRMDVATTAAVWVACKEQAKLDGMEVGTDEYWQHVTELYERCLRETQPMYDDLHRNEYQKDREGLMSYLFPFRTVPIQNHGQLANAYENMRAARKSGDKARMKAANRFFRKTVAAQTMSAAVFSVMTFLAAALKRKTKKYRDDDEEISAETIGIGIGKDVVGTLISVFAPLFGSTIWDTGNNIYDSVRTGKNLRSYDSFSVGVVDLLNELESKTKDIATDVAGLIAGNDLDQSKFRDHVMAIVEAGAKCAGIPYTTIKTYYGGVKDNITDILEGRIPALNDEAVDRANSLNAKRYIEAIAAGDQAKADAVMAELRANILEDKPGLSDAKVAGKVQSAITAYVKETYLDGDMDEATATKYLVDYGSAEDEHDAFWKIREWEAKANAEEGEDVNTSNYRELYAAIDRNDSSDAAVKELTSHGYKEKDVRNAAKDHIVERYEKGEITVGAMKELLARHCRITKPDEVQRIINAADCYKNTGIRLGSLQNAYLDGEVNESTAKSILMKYDGKDSDTASKMVRYWSVKKKYPDMDITEAWSNHYYDGTSKTQENGHQSASAAGMTVKQYVDAMKVLSKVSGTDSNGDGKTDTNSKEIAYIAAIDAMNLTGAQKWALYYEVYKGANWKKIQKPNW